MNKNKITNKSKRMVKDKLITKKYVQQIRKTTL